MIEFYATEEGLENSWWRELEKAEPLKVSKIEDAPDCCSLIRVEGLEEYGIYPESVKLFEEW